MNPTIKKWIDKNILNPEYTKTVEGLPMIFIKYEQREKLLKYLNKIKAKYKYDTHCNYEYISIIFN